MNKTLLLMLIDFLLLHIIHDSPWDKIEKKTARHGGATQTFAKHMDEMNFVRLQLKQESTDRQLLAGDLLKTQSDLEETEGELNATQGKLDKTEEERLIALKDARERGTLAEERAKQLQEQKDILAQKEKDIKDRDGTIAKRDSTLKEFDTKINNLTKERDGLKSDKASLTDEKKDLTAKVDNLTKDKDALTVQNTGLQKENAQLTTDNNGLKRDNHTLTANYKTSSGRVIALNGQLQAAKTTVATLQGDKDKLEKENTNLASAKEKLGNDLAAVSSRAASLDGQLVEEKKRSGTLNVQLAAVKDRQAETDKQLAVATKEREEATKTVERVVKTNEDLRENIQRVAELAQKDARAALEETKELARKQARDPSELYNEYVRNLVPLSMQLNGSGGIVYKNNKPVAAPKNLKGLAQPVLVQGKEYLYALVHSSQTPFDLEMAGLTWKTANGAFYKGGKTVPVHWLGFMKKDPRVVAVPLHPKSKEIFKTAKIYNLSERPQDHAEAVVVRGGKNYGRVLFRVVPGQSSHVRVVKQNIIEKLANPRFQPQKGDVVLSRTGEFLGVMVNNNYCLMVSKDDMAQKNIFADFVVLNKKTDINGLGKKLKDLAKLVPRSPSDLR